LGATLAWLRNALALISASNKVHVSAAVAVYIASTLVYALRTVIVMHWQGVHVSLRDSYIAYLMNMFVNNITPSARAGGELVRAAFIARRYGLSLPSVINVVAFERATEAIGIVVLVVFTALYGIYDLKSSEYLAAISAAIFLALLIIYRYWDRLFHAAMVRLERRGWLRYDSSETLWFSDMLSNKVLLAIGVLFGVMVWFLDALRLYFIGKALGVEMDLVRYIGVSVLYAGIGLLAVTPGGLGIVEGGLTAVLVALGVSPGDAIAVTLIERLISYGLGTLLGAMGLVAAGGMKAWKALRSQ